MERYILPQQERNALERLRQAFAVYQLVDGRVVTLAVSDGFCELFGYADRAEAIFDMDNDMYKNDHPDDAARIADAAYRFATEGGRYDVIYRTKNRGGSGYRIIHACGEHVFTDTGVRLAHVWYCNEGMYNEDSDRQGMELNRYLSGALHENSIVKASRYDYLTGLPSMTFFFELAETGSEHVRAAGGNPVMMYLDFVGMKFYNAKHGFAQGDRLLQGFGKLLAATFGNENCCRISADHFAVISEDAGLKGKLRQVFRECGEINGGKSLPVHVGVYVARSEMVHTSLACDRAKLACTALKGRYETAVNYYRRSLSEDASKRQYIVENIDRALAEKWIKVYLQPIIRAVNERVCDVEALARWIDPEHGVLSPADFIPALEDAGLIYKLDLYMVDQVLESIKFQQSAGFLVVPHSINLSRSDFDACDMVEEIRRRVDDSDVNRDRITIEITESVIGTNFDFIKTQVERFRQLGFPVWMDDFGSGYSSLDVLQSIKFDLIKFDMSFMRKLDQGDSGKIILTELMRMATALGVDTVCEGVETGEQARFLREIGCSKLQGYYYSKPLPFETVLELRRENRLIENENPAESEYFESIGRVNLFDLGVITGRADESFQNTHDTIPIAVLEIRGDTAVYVRSNRSYRDFLKQFFNFDVSADKIDAERFENGYGQAFLSVFRQCAESGGSVFFDERMPDRSVAHFYLRRINTNPITGTMAMVIAVLSISQPDGNESYADIARALAADYYKVYVVDLDTDLYIYYAPQADRQNLTAERRGEGFFANTRKAAENMVYEDDREMFVTLLKRENVLRELDEHGVFIINCRRNDNGSPAYTSLKITRLQGTNRIIVGISDIDAYMKRLEEEKRLRQEKTSLSRIAALSPDYIVLYVIDPDTGRYTQYSPSSEFAKFGLAVQGEDFFGDVVLDAPKAIAPEDMERHLRVMTKENMLAEIEKTGMFTHNYRIIMGEKYIPASLKAIMTDEDDGRKIILGVTNDENEEIRSKLEEAQKIKELNQTITSLLDNMPGLTFTKDAETGVYLACNQNFAVYANKASPEGVIGLTDEEIFDPDTAAHFVEDDRRAVSSENAYIFFEDVPDAAGRQRQFQTTKFKYTDASGRLCLQGMCQDVTDLMRIRREHATTVDELIRQREVEERLQEERLIYARLHAITGNFIVVYVVNPQTNNYREFSATVEYEKSFYRDKAGEDFFASVRRDARVFAHPQDLERFLAAFTKENILSEIERTGIFTWGYRIMMEGKPLHVQMKAAMVEEKEGPRLIVGLNDIDAQFRQEEEYRSRLEKAQTEASLDALTGAKNRHAFLAAEADMDQRIAEGCQSPFAVVVFDVNGLKTVNDTAGHQAGDQYLRDACKTICDIFKGNQVYRVGGDEFALIAQGEDFEPVDSRVEAMSVHNRSAIRSGGIVIACGMAKFDNDESVSAVFGRADQNMYENKNKLKSDFGSTAAEHP